MCFRVVNLMVTVLLMATPTAAQEPSSAIGSDETQVIRELVQDLGAADFSVRQKATSALLKLDAGSVAVLEAQLQVEASSSPSGETSSRLKTIVTQLRRRLFDDRLESLEQNLTAASAAALPEWERFSAIAGDDQDAVNVFLEVLKAERSLFSVRLFAPKELSLAVEKRSKAFSALCNGRQQEAFPVATCVALMLLGSDRNTRLVRATSTNISEAFDDPRFATLLRDGEQAEILRQVTSAWLERSGPGTGVAVDRPLLFAIQLELPVGRVIARRVIESRSRNQSMYYALLCLAKLNSQEDLALVEELLETNDKLWPAVGESVERLLPGRKVESQFSVQTRDVALSVAIHLRGQHPDDFGIDVVPSSETLFSIPSMGFENDEVRASALKRYRSAFPEVLGSDSDSK